MRELRGGILPTKRAGLVGNELLGVLVSDRVIVWSRIVLIGLSGGDVLDCGLKCVHVLRCRDVSVEHELVELRGLLGGHLPVVKRVVELQWVRGGYF